MGAVDIASAGGALVGNDTTEGDDSGQSNISAYAMGMVGYQTPNIDRIADEGMIFTDYYGEPSCTAGRSSYREDLPPGADLVRRFRNRGQRPDDQSTPGFVGPETCASCHSEAYDAWHDSHHGWAWRTSEPENVLGDFNGAVWRCVNKLRKRLSEAEECGMNSPRRIVAWLLLFIAAGVAPIPSGAQQSGTNAVPPDASQELRLEADAPEITPADVYARMSRVHGGIELIRFVMGKKKSDGAEITVTGVAPREVYFQAVSMFRKANRLSFEQTREVDLMPEPPAGDIHPGNVLAVVNAALERISHIKDRLEITTVPATQQPDSSKTPTDVFRTIVQANRQLNLLLDEEFAPSDVFQQVTLAVGYAARLRARFPGGRIPEAPELVAGKQPLDVYRRLIECFSVLRDIAADSGLDILEFQTSDDHTQYVTPSDVYDIATLLVSELAHIHSQLDGAESPRQVYYPGRKFPSDVDQRAGILKAQLLELRGLVADHPDWLSRPKVDR